MAEMSQFARTIYRNKYAWPLDAGGKEEWPDTARRVVNEVMAPYFPELVPRVTELVAQKKFMPGGRYLYAAGRRYSQVNNCFLFFAEDSRVGWGDLMSKVTQSLMTGGGIGVVYSRVRPENYQIAGMGGQSTGPCALMQMVNEAGRHIVQGGSRRSAIWAGLHWNHPDVFRFIGLKNWSPEVKALKAGDFNFPAPMDGTNVSVILDDEFFEAVNDPGWRTTYRTWGAAYTVDHAWAVRVYEAAVLGMVSTGEPGFSVDVGENAGEHARNACTEVTSSDDGDMCNLGSINLARLASVREMAEATELGTAFLLCGTLYSKLPTDGMYRTREKNRRLGLGLMGVHEWLLRRGHRYGPCPELGEWMNVYKQSGAFANKYADRQGVSRPVATRAIAPTGTISIIAETTSGIEPVYAVAYKRRYLDRDVWKAQYVVDATAKKLVESGIRPDDIEDAYILAGDVGRRVEFQAWLQGYVDHGISSTINLPPWGSPLNNEKTADEFGRVLLKYLPRLRGITAYPDGARGGQPLTWVPYQEAAAQEGVEFEDGSENQCKSGVCGG